MSRTCVLRSVRVGGLPQQRLQRRGQRVRAQQLRLDPRAPARAVSHPQLRPRRPLPQERRGGAPRHHQDRRQHRLQAQVDLRGDLPKRVPRQQRQGVHLHHRRQSYQLQAIWPQVRHSSIPIRLIILRLSSRLDIEAMRLDLWRVLACWKESRARSHVDGFRDQFFMISYAIWFSREYLFYR